MGEILTRIDMEDNISIKYFLYINKADFTNKNGLYIKGNYDGNMIQAIKLIEAMLSDYFALNYDNKIKNRDITINEINEINKDIFKTELEFRRKLIY